ncbi:ABC transporter substrate-binding protein [Novosphingobium album (ex Liu et al. 2023)]|uniref:ABC transporter substrate-binding protein n=1 Tax=Novosphingobium album (ex Liu et al. 2023) TaxID=3031130 RepID=A0ABT5WL60_9SPHN|nr:ABC transporter substrate-binding protein [Novosphingobium album (ex Liu et al. 2023)]MDE8650782.1 ABC transporter substrate-binding protein [Novosphingobium album (ex Liu et al. 2023)]
MSALPKVPRLTACLAALLLAACGSSDNSRLELVVIGEPSDPFEGGMRLSLAGQLARASIIEGLVAFDEQGRVIPALADRWIVTDDGQSYIFRLRDGDWRNGEPITAPSAKEALDRALRNLRGTSLGLDLAGIDEVRAMAGRVIEIRLRRPMPHLLQLLAQPELGLLHDGMGAGPMVLDREIDSAVFTPIEPSRLGLPAIKDWDERTRQLSMSALPGAAAIDRFNQGEADLVLGGQIQDFPRTSSVGILRGTIKLDPVTGLFGLQVMNDTGFLGDSANREALAMAIDRDALIAPFGVGGWVPSTRVVSPGLEGDIGTIGERWPEQSLEERRKVAAARVARWHAQHGKPALAAGKRPGARPAAKPAAGAPSARNARQGQSPARPAEALRLSVWLPAGPGSDMLFTRIAQDLAAIGVTAVRAPEDETGDLRLIDDVARYPRAAWYLNRLSCAVKRGLCAADADALVTQAGDTTDPAERAALLTEAEAELTSANVYIPFGAPIRWSLVRGNVSGFATNAWAWHPLMPLAWLPK